MANQVHRIAVLPGDGIGPEIMRAACRVLEAVAGRYGFQYELKEGLIGGAAYEEYQQHFPDATKALCAQADAILFGAVGGPVDKLHLDKWKGCEVQALLGIRKAFSFNINLRPVRVFPELQNLSPLKPEVIGEGLDILFVRELLGDIYFGEKRTERIDGQRVATDIAQYTEEQIRAVAQVAFEAAKKRSGRLASVDKANVLEVSRLWRAVVTELAADYPEVALEHVLVDNCAMQLIRNPRQYDVLLCGNMFGDILSDAGAVLPGSLGLLASASMNAEGFGLYEPPGGSAQDIAGKGVVNPSGQILSLALMLKHSFGLDREAKAIEAALSSALQAGARTADICNTSESALSTTAFTDAILSELEKQPLST